MNSMCLKTLESAPTQTMATQDIPTGVLGSTRAALPSLTARRAHAAALGGIRSIENSSVSVVTDKCLHVHRWRVD